MINRRDFIYSAALGGLSLSTPSMLACTSSRVMNRMGYKEDVPLISLAQWSLNRAFFGGDLDPNKFPLIAKRDFDIR